MSNKDSKTIGNSMEKTREFHIKYLRAINNPVRRKILRAFKDDETTIESLTLLTGLDIKSLYWHLGILEHGFCVEKIKRNGITFYKLTQEGRVIDYIDK